MIDTSQPFIVERLTPRESQVARLLLEGYSTPKIALALNVSRETIKTHVAHILSKTGAPNRRALYAGEW